MNRDSNQFQNSKVKEETKVLSKVKSKDKSKDKSKVKSVSKSVVILPLNAGVKSLPPTEAGWLRKTGETVVGALSNVMNELVINTNVDKYQQEFQTILSEIDSLIQYLNHISLNEKEFKAQVVYDFAQRLKKTVERLKALATVCEYREYRERQESSDAYM